MPNSAVLSRAGRWSRLSQVVTWAGVAIVIGVSCAVGWLGWYEYGEAFDNESDRTAMLARILEDHATRTVETTAIALASIAELLTAQAAGDATLIAPALGHALVGLPFLRSVSVLDRQGNVLAATSGEDRGRMIDLRPLGEWPQPGRDRLGSFIAGRTLDDISTSGGRRTAPRGVGFIPLTRQVQMSSGEGLLLVALINPDAFSNHQTMTADDAHVGAMLADYTGELLAATPSIPLDPGTVLRGHPVFVEHLARSEHLSYIGAGARPGDQVVAFRLSRSRALVSMVEYPASAVRAHWWHAMQPLFAVAVTAVFFLAAMTFTARRSLLNRERTERELDAQRAGVVQRERAFQQQLQTQLDVTALMLEISPLPLWVLDGEGRYASVNQAWEEFTGRRRADVIGDNEARHMTIESSSVELASQRLLLLQGQRARCEARVTHGDGSQRDTVLIRVALPADAATRGGVLCVLMDVSEFRDAERAMKEARGLAEASSRAKSEFIANISHELRTPLQSILGFSELGIVRGREHARLAAMFTDIHGAGERMLALVNDLLDVSKLESSVGPFRMARGDLRDCVRDVAAELAPLLAARQLRLDLVLPGDALDARADALRMHQVVRNVLANAIKFSPPGSCITASAQREGDRIRVRIDDQGPGIPPDELERIFEPFVQSSQTKDGSGGTGLGLAICRRILAVHGGEIHAANRPEGGASFRIELPALQPDS